MGKIRQWMNPFTSFLTKCSQIFNMIENMFLSSILVTKFNISLENLTTFLIGF
jgi:hypothetical protein